MNEKKFMVLLIIFTLFLAIVSSGVSAVQSNKNGRLLDNAREQCSRAVEENRRLEQTLAGIRNITAELSECTLRDITSIREAVELLEELREKIYVLEMYSGDFDIDGYYASTDCDFGL